MTSIILFITQLMLPRVSELGSATTFPVGRRLTAYACEYKTDRSVCHSNFYQIIQTNLNEPDRHSFSVLLAAGFKPSFTKSFCTAKNSDFRMPASASLPPRFNCATIRRRSAISSVEIKFAQIKSYCRTG